KLRAVLSSAAVAGDTWDGTAPDGAEVLERAVDLTALDVRLSADPADGFVGGGTYLPGVPNTPHGSETGHDTSCFAPAIANTITYLARKHGKPKFPGCSGGMMDVTVNDDVNDGVFDLDDDVATFFMDHAGYTVRNGADPKKLLSAKQA